MSLIKLTFDGSLNTAKNDAMFNYYLTNKTNGIFYDLGGRVNATSSNGKIIFDDGFVSIYGRRLYIERNTLISINLDSIAFGVVVVKINTAANTAVITTKENSSNYPKLIQTNLMIDDGEYELPICYYKKTQSSISLDNSHLIYINNFKDQLNETETKLNRTINSQQHGIISNYIAYSSFSNGRHIFDISKVEDYNTNLISFYLANNLFTFNSETLSQFTAVSFTYIYLNQFYTASISKENSKIFLTAGDTSHKVKGIWISH